MGYNIKLGENEVLVVSLCFVESDNETRDPPKTMKDDFSVLLEDLLHNPDEKNLI